MSSSDPLYKPKQLLSTATSSKSVDSDVFPNGFAKEPSTIHTADRVESATDSDPSKKELAEDITAGLLISEVIGGHDHRSPASAVRFAPAATPLPPPSPPAPFSHSLHSPRQQGRSTPLETSVDHGVRISAALADARSPGLTTVAPIRTIQAPSTRHQILNAPIAPVKTASVQTLTPPASSSSISSNVEDKRRTGSNSSRLRTAGLPMVVEVVDPILPMQVQQKQGQSSAGSAYPGAVASPLPTPPLRDTPKAKSSPQGTQIRRGNYDRSEHPAIYNRLTPEANSGTSLDNGCGVGSEFLHSGAEPTDETITYQPRSIEEPVPPKESVPSQGPTPQYTMALELPEDEYIDIYGPPEKIGFQSALEGEWSRSQLIRLHRKVDTGRAGLYSHFFLKNKQTIAFKWKVMQTIDS